MLNKNIYLYKIRLKKMINKRQKKVALVSGAAGFIGFHVSLKLLKDNWRVIGIDNMSNYYDVSLKKNREKKLLIYKNYKSKHANIEDKNVLLKIFEEEEPEIVIHLAAQAGVRYSIENPRTYIESNVIGTFELLEAARTYPPKHILLASTSSAYGVNKKMPYKETDKSDFQISFYAATKKSTEIMAHSYAHLFNIPTTMFRFFTVYGPWGRPDMALFKFTKAILEKDEIDVYNFGKMKRDFTYIDDLVNGVVGLINCIPDNKKYVDNKFINFDSKSPVAPFRIVNIGNSDPIELLDFINAIEEITGIKAKINYMPMQAGDIPATWADTSLIKALTNYKGSTKIHKGIRKFVEWYRNYYQI